MVVLKGSWAGLLDEQHCCLYISLLYISLILFVLAHTFCLFIWWMVWTVVTLPRSPPLFAHHPPCGTFSLHPSSLFHHALCLVAWQWLAWAPLPACHRATLALYLCLPTAFSPFPGLVGLMFVAPTTILPPLPFSLSLLACHTPSLPFTHTPHTRFFPHHHFDIFTLWDWVFFAVLVGTLYLVDGGDWCVAAPSAAQCHGCMPVLLCISSNRELLLMVISSHKSLFSICFCLSHYIFPFTFFLVKTCVTFHSPVSVGFLVPSMSFPFVHVAQHLAYISYMPSIYVRARLPYACL